MTNRDFRSAFVVKIEFAPTEADEFLKFAPGGSPNATPADEFALFNVFAGRHSKTLKIVKFTLRLAQARGISSKIIEINVLVARLWDTSAKPRRPGLEKYASQIQ